ncbi:hypothetical protein HYFRA_00006528 [Hymenoscyphus fraxineus]|uniref:Xylanolytic transcriptional activator regulatory domain-containing protein n=1 Tax=Hymenoscyphus fraxineus TaxID=746836 RepID=A0A9N9KNJ3_9HELO|nr:hypothetical protein HYFRA_00006528 [Hymenoscyphus fraxineus]
MSLTTHTMEAISRTLHIPPFRRDCQTLWLSENNPSPSTAFLVQLKLVLAIGAITYDNQFSLRASAFQWVHEAITYISERKFKSRLDTSILQTNILLLIAQERVGVGADSTWISVGTVFKKAVLLGLHRDPARLPKWPDFVAGTRRRLRSTILVVVTLRSNLSSEGRPMVSLSDFDTAPPGNFDGDQFVATNDPVTQPEDVFTQVSISKAISATAGKLIYYKS